MSAQPDVVIRPTRRDDAQAIAALHARNGLEQVSAEGWAERWESYPFVERFHDVPWGWVLETPANEIVGSIGNVHMLYEFGGRPVRAAIATNWAVDATYRFKALNLTTTFFKQKNVELLINGSANPSASKVLSGMNIPRIPVPTYAQPLFWAASNRGFAHAVLQRKGVPAAASLAWPVALGLSLRDLVTGGKRQRPLAPWHLDELSVFDERFDSLWTRLAAGPKRLRAVRTRAALAWRFSGPASERVICVLQDGSQALGYLVLIRRPGRENGLSLFDVADVQAVNDEPRVYQALLRAAVKAAADRGADAIKLLTGTPSKRTPLMELGPFSYVVDNWPLYHRAVLAWREELAGADQWDFSLFDTY